MRTNVLEKFSDLKLNVMSSIGFDENLQNVDFGPRDLSYWRDWCWYHQTKCHKISLWVPSKFKSMESPGNKILILGCKKWIPRLQFRLKLDEILCWINSINH